MGAEAPKKYTVICYNVNILFIHIFIWTYICGLFRSRRMPLPWTEGGSITLVRRLETQWSSRATWAGRRLCPPTVGRRLRWGHRRLQLQCPIFAPKISIYMYTIYKYCIHTYNLYIYIRMISIEGNMAGLRRLCAQPWPAPRPLPPGQLGTPVR